LMNMTFISRDRIFDIFTRVKHEWKYHKYPVSWVK
jgi:hypothetical protein